MFNFPPWDVAGIIAIAFLAISFYKWRSATWFFLLVGFIAGLITAGIYFLKDNGGFNWILIKKICIVAALAGALFDIIYAIAKPPARRRS